MAKQMFSYLVKNSCWVPFSMPSVRKRGDVSAFLVLGTADNKTSNSNQLCEEVLREERDVLLSKHTAGSTLASQGKVRTAVGGMASPRVGQGKTRRVCQ